MQQVVGGHGAQDRAQAGAVGFVQEELLPEAFRLFDLFLLLALPSVLDFRDGGDMP